MFSFLVVNGRVCLAKLTSDRTVEKYAVWEGIIPAPEEWEYDNVICGSKVQNGILLSGELSRIIATAKTSQTWALRTEEGKYTHLVTIRNQLACTLSVHGGKQWYCYRMPEGEIRVPTTPVWEILNGIVVPFPEWLCRPFERLEAVSSDEFMLNTLKSFV